MYGTYSPGPGITKKIPRIGQFVRYWTSGVKNERANVPISFGKRNQNILVSFPNVSLLKTGCFDIVQNLLSWAK
jgi:hypothetical protein